MRDAITQQGRLDFSVAPRLQTIWGFREAVVFFLEGLGVSIFVAFMLLNNVSGMLVGIILVIAAVLLLLSHLGHPFRAWMAIRNVRRSWVSRGTAVISGFIGLGVAYIGFALIVGFAISGWWDASIRSVLALAAFFILLYPGFAMATSAAIPFWSSRLLPVLSMLNGIASGGLVVLAYLVGTEQARLTIGWVDLVWVQQSVLCLLAVITLVYMVTMSNAGAAAGLSAAYLITQEPMLFWVLAIGAGLALPIAIVTLMLTFNVMSVSSLWVAVVARLALVMCPCAMHSSRRASTMRLYNRPDRGMTTMAANEQRNLPTDDVWIPSVCMGCYNCCGIRIHRVDGRIVDIEGDPAAPNSRGHICAKGKARFLDLADPDRVLRPLKRGNPVKGLGVDPQWQEISWDEALDTITDRLGSAREQDPRTLVIAHFDMPGYGISKAFGAAFGTPNLHWNRADYCGSAPHVANLLLNGSFNGELDFDKTRYMVLWGTQIGALVETIPLHAANKMAEARANGAKLVVIDPFCGNAAAKADEWVPLKPGTDGILALAMLNVLLNELGLYDAGFLKSSTNGPYLIGDDGHYIREAATGKPLIWDDADRQAKAFDDATLSAPALEGQFLIGNQSGRPAFQVLKEHLRQFTVADAERITTVPAATIRKITKDFGEAASIGSTISIDGHEVAVQARRYSFQARFRRP